MPFHGIEVYEILENGNILNGIYTNTGLRTATHYAVDNEIARKQVYDNLGVTGLYNCRYIEDGNPLVVICVLTIVQRNEVYEFTWSNATGPIWTGLGLKVGNNHIAVSYV